MKPLTVQKPVIKKKTTLSQAFEKMYTDLDMPINKWVLEQKKLKGKL